MGNTIKYLPGPTIAEEYTSLQSLGEAIRDRVFAKIAVASLGWGETGTPPWVAGSSSWTYTANSGQPYLQHTWDDVPGTGTVQARFRFSSALVGMLDPTSWLTDIYLPMGLQTRAEWDSLYQRNTGTRYANLINSLSTIMSSSGLCRSPVLSSSVAVFLHTFGANVGKAYGLSLYGIYNPNSSEQLPPPAGPGIKRGQWSLNLTCIDADDGTISWFTNQLNIGGPYSSIPQVVTQPGGSDASWQDLADATDLIPPSIGDVKDSIDNNWKQLQADIPGVDEFWTKLPKSIQYDDPEAVTHPDDQATDPWTPVVASPPAQAAVNPGFLPAVLAVPYALATISKPALVKVGSVMATGVASAEAYRSGFFSKVANAAQNFVDVLSDKAVDLVDWITGPSGVPTLTGQAVQNGVSWLTGPNNPATRTAEATERQADSCESAHELVERIAVALERIADELCRDPEDPAHKPGITNAVELASQTKSEITLRAHGIVCEAATGMVTGGEEE